ncbi:MAG TPA: hypothetical protein VHX68_10400 [Planctomycetaceae bacterium]|jgi:hypothetical protein|nr:hypothetical protein [Planctomycetaceae bacterium]
MRKICSWTLVACGLLAIAFLVTTTARQAQARPLYYQWWLQKYPDVAKKNNVKAAVKCNVCHVGTKKSDRNDYGKALIKGLDGHKNVKKKDKDIFDNALKTAEGEKSGTPDKTFGDLLKDGELPVAK